MSILTNHPVIITDTIKKLEQWLKNWRIKPAVILLGDIGVGKTFSIRYVADKNGYDIIYLDRKMDWKQIVSRPVNIFGRKMILHIDRPYTELGMNNRVLVNIILSTKIPVVIEDDKHQYRFYQYLRENRRVAEKYGEIDIIYVNRPNIYKLLRFLKKNSKFKIRSRDAGNDIRQLIYMALGSMPQSENTAVEWIRKLLMGEKPRGFDKATIPLIADNVEYFELRDAVYLLKMLGVIDCLDYYNVDYSPLLWKKPVYTTREYNNIYYMLKADVEH